MTTCILDPDRCTACGARAASCAMRRVLSGRARCEGCTRPHDAEAST